MTPARFLVLAAGCGLALAFAAPAAACSVGEDYRVPTHLEMARDAELVLLARVTGEMSDDELGNGIAIEPVAALKGALPPGPVELWGMALAEGDAGRYGMLSNPYELEQAHPVSYIGACIRYLFPRGTTALFFLREVDHRWVAAPGPFSRWAEDVPGPDAPWAALVRLYVRAAALPESEAQALLESERDRLLERAEDPVNRLMAADIERQLNGPNETWNAQMREQLGLEGDFYDSDAEAAAEEAAAAIDAAIDDAGAAIDGEDGAAYDDPATPHLVEASCEPDYDAADEAAQVAAVRRFFELGDGGHFAEIGPLLLPGATGHSGEGDVRLIEDGLSDAAADEGREDEHTELTDVITATDAVAVRASGGGNAAILNFRFEAQCIARIYFL